MTDLELLLSIPEPWGMISRCPIDRFSADEFSAGLDALVICDDLVARGAFRADWERVFELLYMPADEFNVVEPREDGSFRTWAEHSAFVVQDMRDSGMEVEDGYELAPVRDTPFGPRTDLSGQFIRRMVRMYSVAEFTVDRLNEHLTSPNRYPVELMRLNPPAASFEAGSVEFELFACAHRETHLNRLPSDILAYLRFQELTVEHSDRLLVMLDREWRKALYVTGKWIRTSELVNVFYGSPSIHNRDVVPVLEEILDAQTAHGMAHNALATTLSMYRD